MVANTSSHVPLSSFEAEDARQLALAETSIRQHLEELGVIQLKLLALQGDLDHQVARLRLEGTSWARIAAVLKISPQAAHQRWSPEGVEKHRLRQRRLHGLSNKTAK